MTHSSTFKTHSESIRTRYDTFGLSEVSLMYSDSAKTYSTGYKTRSNSLDCYTRLMRTLLKFINLSSIKILELGVDPFRLY